MSDVTNGDLPPAREAVIEQAHRLHQEVAHERDELRKRVAELMTEIAGLKAQLQIAELNVAQLENKAASAMATKDEAVARQVNVESVLRSIMALGRAFNVQNEPLIKETSEYADQTPVDRGIAGDGSVG